ncbi:hypothetical protein [Acinetobacter sp. 199]|uniref:hypothetical protein n=1 Tax=Acinetobacter sp. 199 TaxID=3114697 RepID=UPI003A85FE08
MGMVFTFARDLFFEFIRPIISHIVINYNNNDGFAIKAQNPSTLSSIQNINFYNRINNDATYKKLFKDIFISYENCVYEISTKENEITCEDFLNL